MELKHICPHPPCRALVPPTQKYCDKHKHLQQKPFAQAVRASDKISSFSYSSRWRKLATSHKRQNPWCVACAAAGKQYVPVQVSDHIFPVADNPQHGYNPLNLQSLCKDCHTRATRLEVAARNTGRNPASYKQRQLGLRLPVL